MRNIHSLSLIDLDATQKNSTLLLWKNFISPRKSAYLTLAGLVSYQLCYSIAPIFLGHSISAEASNSMMLYLAIYFLLNYIPYVFMFFVSPLSAKWVSSARKNISLVILNKFAGRYELSTSKEHERAYVALITNNSQSIVSDAINYIKTMVLYLSSSTFTLIVISFYADLFLTLTYLASLVIVSFVIINTKKKQQRRSAIEQAALSNTLATIGSSWTTITLSQLPFSKKLFEYIDRKWKRNKFTAVATATYFQRISMLNAVIIWVPTVFVFLYGMHSKTHTESLVLLAFAPRMVELLLDISNFAMRLLDFGYHTGRLKWLSEEIAVRNNNNPKERIDFSKIKIREDYGVCKSISCIDELIELMPSHPDGRIRTILGSNGSGKTSLLVSLKILFKDDAFLVLAGKSQLIDAKDKSEGQAKIEELEKIIGSVPLYNYKYLLLDEWCANLDVENERIIRSKLKELSSIVTVIEVVHEKKFDICP